MFNNYELGGPNSNIGSMRIDTVQSSPEWDPSLSQETPETTNSHLDAGAIEEDEDGRGYYLDTLGPQRRIIVKDTNFTILYTGQYSMTATDEKLIEEAKIALGLPI